MHYSVYSFALFIMPLVDLPLGSTGRSSSIEVSRQYVYTSWAVCRECRREYASQAELRCWNPDAKGPRDRVAGRDGQVSVAGRRCAKTLEARRPESGADSCLNHPNRPRQTRTNRPTADSASASDKSRSAAPPPARCSEHLAFPGGPAAASCPMALPRLFWRIPQKAVAAPEPATSCRSRLVKATSPPGRQWRRSRDTCRAV